MLHDEGSLDLLEYTLYKQLFTHLQSTIAAPLAAIVYVDTDPETCAKRIVTRGRSGEEGIPLEYLRELHKFQSDWINTTDVPTVRAHEASEISQFVNNLLSPKRPTLEKPSCGGDKENQEPLNNRIDLVDPQFSL